MCDHTMKPYLEKAVMDYRKETGDDSKTAEAKSRFYRLIDYGEQHLWDEVKIEYFAVSLPEFQIFNEDYTARNKAHCYYLMGLGNWGLGEEEKAKEFFHKALEIEPSHMQCTLYLSNLES